MSRSLQHGTSEADASGMRIPAREIEGAVIARIRLAFLDPISLLAEANVPIDAQRLPSQDMQSAGRSD